MNRDAYNEYNEYMSKVKIKYTVREQPLNGRMHICIKYVNIIIDLSRIFPNQNMVRTIVDKF